MSLADPVAARRARVAALRERPFDLLVVGGGITGAGIARDAALRGLTVALVEKNDFASGTSSRSSRLIHGGVRYLEHGHLHLVFESSAERRRLLRLAPHLVRPLAFTWPVYAGARIPRWKLGAGLLLYDLLALFRNVRRHRRLSAEAVLVEEPMLRRDGLRGGARYYDAATDDVRLTLANALGAAEAGAVVVNHVAMQGLVESDGRITGATLVDAIDNTTLEVAARSVVDATGPWSTSVRGSKGAHIAVARDRIGNREALTLLSPRDGRVFFVLPADAHAIIGTTDTYTEESPDDVRASADDVQYLLDAANEFFPSARLTKGDVVSAWAGIRPLLPASGKTPGAASREHAITHNDKGLISITGGKLTTYRIMAAEVVDLVTRSLRRDTPRSTTALRPLPGGDIDSLDHTVAAAARATHDDALAEHLARAYGSRWHLVWDEIGATSDGTQRVDPSLPYTIGELRYSVRYEMAVTLGDLLLRRTHLAFESRDHSRSAAARVAEAVAPLLGWDAQHVVRALADYELEVRRIFGIRA